MMKRAIVKTRAKQDRRRVALGEAWAVVRYDGGKYLLGGVHESSAAAAAEAKTTPSSIPVHVGTVHRGVEYYLVLGPNKRAAHFKSEKDQLLAAESNDDQAVISGVFVLPALPKKKYNDRMLDWWPNGISRR